MAEQKKGWFSRLTDGLSRSSRQMTEQVVSVLTKMKLDEEANTTLIQALAHHAVEGRDNPAARRIEIGGDDSQGGLRPGGPQAPAPAGQGITGRPQASPISFSPGRGSAARKA